MSSKELNKRGSQKFHLQQFTKAKSCYKYSCYKKDFEGCYQFATLIGYDDKNKLKDLLSLICKEGYKKACPSSFDGKKVYPRESENVYSPNEQSTLRSWTKLLGKTLERNLN